MSAQGVFKASNAVSEGSTAGLRIPLSLQKVSLLVKVEGFTSNSEDSIHTSKVLVQI